MSVRRGILKMVGPKKQDFWPRINIRTQRKEFQKILSMNDSLTKSQKCQNRTFKVNF